MKKITLDNLGNVKVSADSTIVDVSGQLNAPKTGGMSMEQLQANYETIVRMKAIFYPVAFQLSRELGRGRQGIVYIGLRQGSRGCITTHAIKVYTPNLYRGPEEYWTDMGRIASQISRLHGVQSPNLVTRHTYEETYGIGYVQLEAIDGLDLRHFLSMNHRETVKQSCTKAEWKRFSETLFLEEGGRVWFQPAVVVYILRSMLRGLERLHSENFLHCDIKPANVMMDRLGYIKVVDFGRAIIAREKVSFLLGSPLYMAPEIHRREPGDFESDFYSVGLVGLELLRGEPILDPATTNENDLLALKMDLPDRLNDLLPPHVRKRRTLVRVIRRLLEPDPANRFGSAKEAEAGEDGLIVVDKQFTKGGEDAEYTRELSDYLSKLVDAKTDRVEMDDISDAPVFSDVVT